MLETLFSTSAAAAGFSLTLTETLIAIAAALTAGFIVSLTYKKTHEGTPSGNFMLTLVLLPAVISVIIMLIGSDVAKAFSLAGAFSIIRFRSAPGDPKDIAYILFTLAGGLAAGAGVPLYALAFTVILCLVMILLRKTRFGEPKGEAPKQLQVTVPEDLDYEEALKDVMEKYTEDYSLQRVKMTAMGSLYVLHYSVTLLPETNIKQFIDALRTRNGNLAINLNLVEVAA